MSGLVNEKVVLRPFAPGDAPAVLAYLNHPELYGRRYVPDDQPALPITTAQADEIIAAWTQTRRRLHLAVTTAAGAELIGHGSAFWGWDAHCPDVQLVIAPEWQRQGYGSAALSLLMDWIFANLPAHNVSSSAADWNTGALAFLESQGFKPAGRSRREGMWAGRFYDEMVMDILRSEWEERNGA